MNQTLTVAICLDNHYLEPAETLLKSLTYHNQNVKIYALHTNVPTAWFLQMQAHISPLANQLIPIHLDLNNPKVQRINQRLAHLDLPPVPFLFSQFSSENNIRLDITQTTYYRLLLPELIDEECLLYLDCDILINGSIFPFNNVEFGDNIIAAAEDIEVVTKGTYGYFFPEEDPYRPTFCRFKGGLFQSYFNAGVLLLDAKAWREQGTCFDLLHFVKMPCPFRHKDQDILNFYFYQNWLPLSHLFNLQIEALWRNNLVVERPANIIHFTGINKPWLPQCERFTQFHEYYQLYRKISWEEVKNKVDNKS